VVWLEDDDNRLNLRLKMAAAPRATPQGLMTGRRVSSAGWT